MTEEIDDNDLGLPLQDFSNYKPNDLTNDLSLDITTTPIDDTPLYRRVLSKLFFIWTIPIMNISFKSPLKASNLISAFRFNITRSDLSHLRMFWFGGYNKMKYYPLLLAIIRANFLPLAILFVVTFIAVGLKFIQLYFLRQLILVFKWIRSPSENKEPFLSLGVNVFCFLLLKIVYIITQYQIKYLENMIGRKTANQISSIVYEKTMNSFSLSKDNFTEGEVLNYIQVDVETLSLFFYYFPKTIVIPFQFTMHMLLLFQFFGSSFVFGFITFAFLMSISFLIQKMYMTNQQTYLSDKDDRMRMTSETFHMLKVLKLFAWDEAFGNKIQHRRGIELSSMRKILNLEVLSGFIHWAIPLILSIVSVGAYTYTNGVMDIANLLSSIDIFDTMSGPLYRLPLYITSIINALVSMERISTFLNSSNSKIASRMDKSQKNTAVKLYNCSFGRKSIIPDNDKYFLTKINLFIKKSELVILLGETGSGKSCLMHSFLNNIDFLPQDNNYEFIVNGTFSYAAQSPWIMNETIQKNITFFKEMNRDRYDNVLKVCQLEKDMSEFPAGDITEVGANGANLSGGQKARISLARAVYANADIYVFDDPISSCDSYVSQRIFKDVFVNYLAGTTRIIVTNDIRGLEKVDKIVYMNKGNISWIGTYDEIQKKKFYIEMLYQREHDSSKNIVNFDGISNGFDTLASSSDTIFSSHYNHKMITHSPSDIERKAKLTKEEDQVEGKVGLRIYHRFIELIGGYLFLGTLLLVSIFWQLAKVGSNVWLAKWTLDDSDNLYSFLIFSQISLLSIFCLFLKDFIISRGILNINIHLHNQMLTRLIKAPINLFHDTIPIGQILNRLSNDLEKCKPIMKIFSSFHKSNCTLIAAIVVCVQYNKYCLILSPLLILCGIGLSYYYINAGRDLNRLDGITRSPILSLYSETIMGMSTIKAFNMEERFKDLFFNRLDDYYSVINFKFGAASCYSLFLELLSILYIFFILIFAMIFKDNFTAQAIGLLIKYSVSFSEEMLGVMDYATDIERSLVSIERCDTFTHVIQEKPCVIAKDNKLKSWPNAGKIEFVSYSTRYRPEIDQVLKNITIVINSKEKIGVVGRTGSGKSTLALALFRILEAESGSIIIDSINISSIGIRKLRESLTIVPQDPILFKGSLGSNLDPLRMNRKEEIMMAIEKVNLFGLMKENGRDVSLGIDMEIKEHGNNLSLGEKQLICFARAILRKSYVIILDEATASVDQKTEKIIQRTIDSVFKDATMITIAHRVQTVMKCDKILVMDNGSVIEYDSPSKLLNRPNSVFRMLYYKNNE